MSEFKQSLDRVLGSQMSVDPQSQNREPAKRADHERRVAPDRGIVLLDAKDRIGPSIWALYGRIDRPAILKDDLYIDNRFNDYYRDSQGRAFLLVPFIEDNDPERYEKADAAYRRAVALGITESPTLFFTCLYQFEIPDYACIDIHAATGQEVLTAQKCQTLLQFEKARLHDRLQNLEMSLIAGQKVKPVQFSYRGELSNNIVFACNMLALHHAYDSEQLNRLWQSLV